MEKIESNIISAELWLKQTFGDTTGYEDVEELIKAVQRQAVEATLEDVAENAQAYITVNNIPLIRKESVLSRINSPELKVM